MLQLQHAKNSKANVDLFHEKNNRWVLQLFLTARGSILNLFFQCCFIFSNLSYFKLKNTFSCCSLHLSASTVLCFFFEETCFSGSPGKDRQLASDRSNTWKTACCVSGKLHWGITSWQVRTLNIFQWEEKRK